MKKGILLIGMPGSGKTTLGKRLAERIEYNFIDIDEFIVSGCGKSIAEIFENGEEEFRNIETENCKLVSKLENVVISSGGGVVTKSENMELFKDFLVVFLNRPLELISEKINTDSRPLLHEGKEKLTEIYRERIDLYNEYKDIEVINDGTKEQVLNSLETKVRDVLMGED